MNSIVIDMCACCIHPVDTGGTPPLKFGLNVETDDAPQEDRKRFMIHILEALEERKEDITSWSKNGSRGLGKAIVWGLL